MKRVAAILIIMLMPLCMDARNVYVVAAGVSDYPGSSHDLTLPYNDAVAISRLYKKNANAKVVLLTNGNATRENILGKAKALFSCAGSDDIVVLFFSGHGYPGGFCAYDGNISYEEVKGAFAGSSAKNKMVFADACFSGKISDAGRDGHSKKKKGVMFFLSSRGNETSIESPRMRNGFFTACLVRCLKGAADKNKDMVITARELYLKVREGVVKLSENKQHPVMWGSFNDEMVVMSWK